MISSTHSVDKKKVVAELAEASGVRLRIDSERVLWFEPGRAVCRSLGADPWGTLASGTLLAAFPPDVTLYHVGCESRTNGTQSEGRRR